MLTLIIFSVSGSEDGFDPDAVLHRPSSRRLMSRTTTISPSCRGIGKLS